MRQHPAPEVLAELALHETRQLHTVRRAGPRLLEEALKVRAHRAVQRRGLGRARRVARRKRQGRRAHRALPRLPVIVAGAQGNLVSRQGIAQGRPRAPARRCAPRSTNPAKGRGRGWVRRSAHPGRPPRTPPPPPSRRSGGATRPHHKGPDRQGAEAAPAASSARPSNSHLLAVPPAAHHRQRALLAWLDVDAVLRAE